MKTKLLLFLIFITSISWGQICPIDETFTSNTLDKFNKEGYTSYDGSASLRLASGSNNGILTSKPDLLVNVSGTVTIDILASGYNSNEKIFTVKLGNDIRTINLNNSGINNLEQISTLVFSNVALNSTLEIKANSGKRIYIKSVKLCYSNCTPPTFSGSINSINNCGNTVLSFNNTAAIPNNELYWQTTANGTDTSFNFSGNRTVLTSGTYYLRRYVGNCWSDSISAIVEIDPIPIMSGELTVLNISCNSAQIAYSSDSETGLYWQTTPTGTDFSNLYAALTVTNSGTYYLRRFLNGCWSDVKQITVSSFSPNSIVAQPQNVNTTVGSNAIFTVSSLYTIGVNYQWQILNGSIWENISGQNASTFTVLNSQLTDSGKQFRVIITDACGLITSSIANLTVSVGPCYAVNFNNITNGNSTTTSGSSSQLSTYSGFNSLNTLYSAGGAIRFGSSGNTGSITSDPLNNVSGNISVEISAKGWSSSENKIYISINNLEQEFTIPTWIGGNFSTMIFNYTNVPANSELKIYTKNTARRAFLDNINIFCTPVCQNVIISSIFPTSGPAGTMVTITSADDLSNQNVFFGTVAAEIVSRSSFQLQFIVPSGVNATNFSVFENLNCVTEQNFTILDYVGNDCYGSNTNSIFISEVYDENSGSLGYIELYNPTNTPINLATYSVRRYGDFTDLASFAQAALSGIIPANGVLVFKINNSGGSNTCQINPLIQIDLSGINDNDLIELYNGTTLLDSVVTPSEIGYTLIRKPNANAPIITYNENDWNILGNEECSDLGSHDYGIISHSVTHSVTLNSICGATSSSIEAFVSTTMPATITGFQWYVNSPNSTQWIALSNGSEYTGATSSTLNILDVSNKINFQYYCEISTSLVSCKTISDAVMLKPQQQTVWNGNTWSNGVPTIVKTAVINGNYDCQLNGSFSACSLIVNSGFSLIIQPNTYVEIENNVSNNGVLRVEDKGQLVQISETAVNTGNIILERKAIYKRWDYSHYSTPVNTANVYSLSPNTLTNRIWEWIPTINGNYGNWINPQGNMVIGRSYAITAPHNFSATTQQEFTAIFNGIPNNGRIIHELKRGNYTSIDYLNTLNNVYVTKWDDNFNLVGNPYPSAISATDFLIHNSDKIESVLSVWVNSGLDANNSDPFYGNYALNYNSNSFIDFNVTGSTNGPGFNGMIGTAQGFFITMKDGVAATDQIEFRNFMRSKNHDNRMFYRTNTVDESRIWIDLVKINNSSNNLVKRILVGYINNATNRKDNLLDGISAKKLVNDFYSLQNNDVEAYSIQARELPFNTNDQVALGVNFTDSGSYSFALAYLTGELESSNQEIYIEDKYLNVLHNVKNGPYQFTSERGRFEDRFVLKYINSILSVKPIEYVNDLIIFGKDVLTIQSSTKNIHNVDVYDTLGRLIDSKKINDRQVNLNRIQKNNAGLILYITLEDGSKVTKKYIY